MEEMIHNLVRNTLKREDAEDIISERISWYEMQIKKRNDILNKIKEKCIKTHFADQNGIDFVYTFTILELLEEIE